jgi:hypothetical protein
VDGRQICCKSFAVDHCVFIDSSMITMENVWLKLFGLNSLYRETLNLNPPKQEYPVLLLNPQKLEYPVQLLLTQVQFHSINLII